jgi:hypothetical protein
LIGAQAFGQLDQQIRLLGFGQHQAAHSRVFQQRQVAIEPRGAVGIAAQINGFVRGQPLANGRTGRHLGLGWDRVLQVNDHRMGTGGQGLVKTLGTVAGYE